MESVEVAQIGKASTKKRVGAAAIGVGVGLATGGLVPLIAVKPAAFFLAVTNQRILLVPIVNGIMGKQVAAAYPRTAVSLGPLKGHLLTLSMDVTLDGTPHKFSWGRAGSRQARSFLAALGGAA